VLTRHGVRVEVFARLRTRHDTKGSRVQPCSCRIVSCLVVFVSCRVVQHDWPCIVGSHILPFEKDSYIIKNLFKRMRPLKFILHPIFLAVVLILQGMIESMENNIVIIHKSNK
jgi:hypothetical protein